MPLKHLPFLTAGVPPIPAAIKRRYEDFRVEEIPAYEPSGRGDHVYFTIEKAGIATMQAVRDIARALGRRPRDIGLAGLKDARAVARQTLSLEHADPDRIRALTIPRIRIVEVSRHTNKLRVGHLRGNRFEIRLRDVDAARLADVRAVLDRLSARGVPNYFGRQRFGLRGDTWRIGEALIRDDLRTAVHLLCGTPAQADTGDVLRARQLFEQGDYEAAARAWPFLFRENARACRAMTRTGGNYRRAMAAVDVNLRKLFISALQSELFNRVLAERIDALDRLLPGDLAWKHDNSAVFRVDDADAEQPRADRFDISPTGPLFGPRMTEPAGRPHEIESRILADAGLTADSFAGPHGISVHGGRRPLRFQPRAVAVEPDADDAGPCLVLRFTLPPGCYATVVLREICKSDLEEGA